MEEYSKKLTMKIVAMTDYNKNHIDSNYGNHDANMYENRLMILMTIMITIAFPKNFQFPLSSISSGCVECTEVSYCFNFFRD